MKPTRIVETFVERPVRSTALNTDSRAVDSIHTPFENLTPLPCKNANKNANSQNNEDNRYYTGGGSQDISLDPCEHLRGNKRCPGKKHEITPFQILPS